MSDFYVLAAVREQLLGKKVGPHIHLALPPQALYPLVLVELEEVDSFYPFKGNGVRKDVQARIKFRVGIYSKASGMEEVTLLSVNIRKTLEGVTLPLPEARILTIRFLACVTTVPGSNSSGQPLRLIQHFYDSLIRG